MSQLSESLREYVTTSHFSAVMSGVNQTLKSTDEEVELCLAGIVSAFGQMLFWFCIVVVLRSCSGIFEIARVGVEFIS